MKPDAVSQAKRRLTKAEAAFEQLNKAETTEAVRIAWSDFLLAIAAIYTKLKRGAPRDGPAREWLDAIEEERENDELLKYIYEARNIDEHGIVEVTGADGMEVRQQLGDGSYVVFRAPEHTEWQNFTVHRHNPDGTKTLISGPIVERKFVSLQPLVDERHKKRGTVYPVPTQHRGDSIPAMNPREAAETALPYFRELIACAVFMSN